MLNRLIRINCKLFFLVKQKYKNLVRVFLKIYIRTFYRVRYVNLHKLSKDEPGIIICNHVSYMDGIILDTAIPGAVHYVIYKKIYNLPFVNFFMRMGGFISIDNNRADIDIAFKKIRKCFQQGEKVCLFPEGELTEFGHPSRFKPGVAWLLKENDMPVYPVVLKGLWGSAFSRKYPSPQQRWKKSLDRSFHKKRRREIQVIAGDRIEHDAASLHYMQRCILELKYNNLNNE